MNVKLSLVVPVYNEEKRFKKGLDTYFTYLTKQKYNWEIILVNDGSTDQTLDLVSEYIKNKKNVNFISYNQNRGKGYAICAGVKAALGEYILFADIDNSVPIETIESFFDLFKSGSTVIIGSRRVNGAFISKHQSLLRETLGRGFTLLVNLLIDSKIKDATCGFKAFKNSTAQKIFNKITIYDWAFDAEIIYICRKYKIKIAQAPVVWTDVKGSKVSISKDVFNSLRGLIKIRINNLIGIYN